MWLVFAVAAAGPLRDRLPGETRHDEYLWCLAWQQPGPGVDDDVAEACTWRTLEYQRWHRMWLAGTGRLETWIDEYRDDRLHARLLHPDAAPFPDLRGHGGAVRPEFDSSWMEGRSPPVDETAAEAMLDEVLRTEALDGRPPREGERPRWSGAFLRRHPWPHFDRMLVNFAGGTSSQMSRTGGEEALVEWIFAQPTGSITVEALFRAAYRVHDGDVGTALLTAENVLSREFLDRDRDDLLLVAQLRPIVDTHADLGDQFGGWYHLFGTMAYSYGVGQPRAWVASTAESWGSRYSNGRGVVEIQEGHLNRIGTHLGMHLRRRVKRWGRSPLPARPAALAEPAYMDRDEFGRADLQQPSGLHAAEAEP